MANQGLLGVGDGVLAPAWVQELTRVSLIEGSATETEARDNRIVKESVTELRYQTTQYSMAVDLASIAANTTSQVDLSLPVADAGKVLVNDYVVFMGAAALNHGLVVQGTLPAPSDNTIRIRVSNLTGGAIDAASTTFYFIVVRRFTV